MALKPKGGTICIQSGGAAAANHNERMQGIRDTLAGKTGDEPPGERLTGQNGWKEAAGCPLYTDDDFPRSIQQMEDTLGQIPRSRRLHADRRLPRIPARRLPQRRDEDQGPDRLGQARPGGRRHAAGADRHPEGRPRVRQRRPAAVRDGLQGHVLPEGHQGRQARRRRTRPIRASTSARRRRRIPAWVGGADDVRGAPHGAPHFIRARPAPSPRSARARVRHSSSAHAPAAAVRAPACRQRRASRNG